jgi:hypothetical protein
MTRFLNFLGSLRAENDAILSLTDQLQLARGEAAKYREAAIMWKATARQISDELEESAPLVLYALKRKASLAAYERKRGRG